MLSNRRSTSQSHLTFQEKLLLSKNDAIVLTGGKTAYGEPFYVYIKTTPEGLQQMREDHQLNHNVDFYAYGEILMYGPGKEPPADVQERIASEYKGV